jgi:hypothetical protein
LYRIIENKEGVIYEDDSEDDEDHVWADHLEPTEEESISEIQANSEIDDKSHRSDELDPYDYVYINLLDDVHILKTVDDCKKCGGKRFQYETKGFCCPDGQVKLAEQETPLELMKLWTSSDDNVKHFRDNIRWFNSHFSFT